MKQHKTITLIFIIYYTLDTTRLLYLYKMSKITNNTSMITTFEIANTRPTPSTPVKASLTTVASLTKKPVPDYLAKKNAHPRDPYIEFDE